MNQEHPVRDAAAAGSAQPWRSVCQQVAQARAEQEARTAWGLVEPAQIPFSFRWEHVQAVVALAMELAAQTGADREIVEAAAWLHDIRKGEPAHGVRGAEAAHAVLVATDFAAAKAAAVAEVIQLHVGLYRADDQSPLTPLEAAVLWDADKLTKLGVQALVYTLSTPAVVGLALHARRYYVDDFVRTVLSRTAASMNTAPGRRLARRRYSQMLAALDAWADESRPSEDPAYG